jgi:pSer/pThr/pTyr-binding forkhead associated (FHA) protein
VSYNANGKLIVLAGPSPGSEYVLDKTITNIGREGGTDLVLNVPGVSRRHARILNKDGNYYLEDIGSSNGTFLNGQAVAAAQQLASGDEIALGNTVKLRFELPELAADLAATRLHAADATDIAYPATAIEAPLPEKVVKETTPPPRIAVSLASGTSVSHELKGQQITIGRAADNDIVLDSPIVSRYHAKLVKDGDKYRIDPLPQVSNPVTINEQPVSAPRQLNHGDVLHIGRSDSPHRVTIAYQESPAVSQAPPMPATVAKVGEDAGTMLAEDFVLPTSVRPPE